MKKYLMILVAVIGFAFSANAESLCGQGMTFNFSGGGDSGTFTCTGGGSGNYNVDRKGDIRIIFNGGTTIQKFINNGNGTYSLDGSGTYKPC
jgi:hypothetical protein